MEAGAQAQNIDDLKHGPLWEMVSAASNCLTCNTCSSRCAAAGLAGFDPRKIVRLANLGREQEIIDSKWIWNCTICGRCEVACPLGVDINKLIRSARGLRPRGQVPGVLHKGVAMCLERGNNLGIPKDEFVWLMGDLSEEMRNDGYEGFEVPIDKTGARLLLTVNSKEPSAEPDDMKHWWKIFYAAEESWTIPSENWEGVNWGLFTGDDAAMHTVVGRIVENYKKLEAKTLVLPE